MKNLTTFYWSLILSLSLPLSAQEGGDFRIGLGIERAQYSSGFAQTYGLDFEFFVSDHFSLGYRFSLGHNQEGKLIAQVPGGAWLAAYPMVEYINNADDFYLLASIILLVIPENLNVHFYLNDTVRLSPFIAPLGMYYDPRDGDANSRRFHPAFTGGLKGYIYWDKLGISPYLGLRSQYRRGSTWALVAGIGVGLTL